MANIHICLVFLSFANPAALFVISNVSGHQKKGVSGKVLRLAFELSTYDSMGAAIIAMETAQQQGLLPGWQIR